MERFCQGESSCSGFKANGLVFMELFGKYWDMAIRIGLQYSWMRMEVSDLIFGHCIGFFITCEELFVYIPRGIVILYISFPI